MRDGIRVDVADVEGVTVATVRGEIDVVSVTVLDAKLELVPPDERVVLDMAGVEFLDSSALAAILRHSIARREAGGSLCIRRPSTTVRRLLEFCCLEHLIESEEVFGYEPTAGD